MIRNKTIRVRGARQNNLQGVDLDIPHNQWLTICGRSGSGKSSLAVQTLYAEGQRRYVESFSPYTRQFLDQAEKPAADLIESVPAAVVVHAGTQKFGRRTTIASITEVVELLRLLYARSADIRCPDCDIAIIANHPKMVAETLGRLPDATRFMIGFEATDWWGSSIDSADQAESLYAGLRELGFARGVVGESGFEFATSEVPPEGFEKRGVWIIVDRLVAGKSTDERRLESVESAMQFGNGRCCIWLPHDVVVDDVGKSSMVAIDQQPWQRLTFSSNLECPGCRRRFRSPDPAMLSNTSPLGACPDCEGFGESPTYSIEKIVPDRSLSIRSGAIAPWNVPSYQHELQELLELASDYEIDVDIPFSKLSKANVALIWSGVKERKFGGLNGFFKWLEKRKYKMHHRVFMSRWRVWNRCEACDGQQLNAAARAIKLSGVSLPELLAKSINLSLEFCQAVEPRGWQSEIVRPVLRQVTNRLQFLQDAGLGQLSLDRPMTTLSSGQAQRVMLTCSLSSTLVNMLYVLDEPSSGLHPANVQQILPAIKRLHQMPNTVVVVDHSNELISASSRVVELGPESGAQGGQIVFDGSIEELRDSSVSPTGEHLTGLRGGSFSAGNRRTPTGKILLKNAAGRNLSNVSIDFPLGTLCLVTGVSGAGKSTLVRDTLLPLVQRRISDDSSAVPLANDGLQVSGKIEEVVFMDSSPPNRTARSIPVTYIKVFDEIRKLFAATPDAKQKNLTAGSFSFNIAGGRCDKCEGEGRLSIDMQFLADVSIICDQCHGKRFQPRLLDVRFRGESIASVLEMTGSEAFSFFRGQPKIQAGLKALKDAGLDYLRLGQALSTLSRGETQRLKLAAHLAASSKKQTLFIFDMPTTGLHMDDVTRMVDGFSSLLDIGHSLIVIEHDLQMMAHADWIIDIGPGSDENGGKIVAMGTPEQIAACPESITGQHLKQWLAKYDVPIAKPRKVARKKAVRKKSS